VSRFRFVPRFAVAFLALAIVHFSSSAKAATAEEIVAKWFQSIKDAGATVAVYEAIRVDQVTDTVTIVKPRFEWQVEFPKQGEPDKKGFSANIVSTVSEIAMVGLREEADGYRIGSYTVSDDNRLVATGQDDTGSPFELSVDIVGNKNEGIFFPKFSAAPEDPQRPISRFMHYYDLFLKVVVDKSSIDKIDVRQMVDGKEIMTAEYNGIVTTGMKNGRVEESTLEAYRQTSIFPAAPNQASGQGAPAVQNMEATYGGMVQRGIDMKVLVEALTAKDAPKDAPFKSVTDEATVTDMTFTVGPVNVEVGKYSVTGMQARPGKFSVLELADRLALGEEFSEKQSAEIGFDIARRFAIGEWSISGISGNGPPNITAKLDSFLLRDLSSEGLGKFEVAGVDVKGPGGEEVRFDRVLIGDVLFPDSEALISAIEKGPPEDPIAAAALGPKIGTMEAADVYVDDKKKPAFSLGLFQLLQSAYVGPIPTDLRLQTRDLSLPVDYIEDPMVQGMLRSLGYDILKIAADFVLNWNEANQDLTLEKADISIDQGAQFSLRAGVAGLPRETIENPALFEQALATLAFKNANLSVRDAKLVPGVIEQFAQLQGMQPADLREALIQSIDLQAGPLAGTPFVEQVKTALRAFLEKPDRLAVDLEPGAPVPFTQILGTAATAPAQAPDLLGASVSAN